MAIIRFGGESGDAADPDADATASNQGKGSKAPALHKKARREKSLA
jgi:hypothetical protein